MSLVPTRPSPPPPYPGPIHVYPDTDGEPMAESTRQFEWIVTIKEGLDAAFRARPDVFVAGDLFWYPVEGHPEIRTAPDALVVVGRPKGHRGSYLQWLEDGLAPQVVVEVLSPGNRPGEMRRKLEFYERYGVDEYYIYDPEANTLEGYLRDGDRLRAIAAIGTWTSPLLGFRFEHTPETLRIHGPDERPFATYDELVRRRDDLERDVAGLEQDVAGLERDVAAERERARRLAERLRVMGLDPDAV